MKKSLLILSLSLSLLLTGCGLIPKKVELFQSKVHSYPTPSEKQIELQRETAQKANDAAKETVYAAIAENSTTNVVAPAKETEALTAAVAEAVGAPAKAPPADSDKLIQELRAQIAHLDRKVDTFVKANNENTGKKIEGTGLVQVPYFAWTGGILVALLVGWYVLRTVAGAAATVNPGAAVGVGAMNLVGSEASAAIQQLVKGGESFKTWVGKEIGDPALQQKILGAFQLFHVTAQSPTTQAVVQNLTPKT